MKRISTLCCAIAIALGVNATPEAAVKPLFNHFQILASDIESLQEESQTDLQAQSVIPSVVAPRIAKAGHLDSGEVTDEHGIILEPAAGTTKEYRRKLISYSSVYRSGNNINFSVQASDAVMVECEDGTVYWKDPISHYRKGSWIKGKKSGTTVSFPAKQPVYASTSYLYTVRFGVFSGNNFNLADDYANNIVFDIVNDSLILRGTSPIKMNSKSECYFIGIFREKFADPGTYSFYGYADGCMNLYVPNPELNRELVTPPVGLVTELLPYVALDGSGYEQHVKDSVSVGWDADTVYIKGICPHLPEAWVKGTLKENTVTFAAAQYVGQFDFTDIWMCGGIALEEAVDYHMQYDAQSNYFVGSAKEYLLENFTNDSVNHAVAAYNKLTIGTLSKRDTVDVVAVDLLSREFSTINGFIFNASSESYPYIILGIMADSLSGTFTMEDISWTYTYMITPKNKRIYFKDGEMTITTDGHTTTLTGLLIGEDEKVYRLSITGKTGGLEYDEQNNPFVADFVWADMDVAIDDGLALIVATNQSSQYVYIQLYVPRDSTSIPAGEYVIADTEAEGTALKSVGRDYYPSAAAVLDEVGNFETVWFMESGKVVISYDEYDKMTVTVNAKNSYDVDITAVIRYEKLEPEAVVDIEASNLQITDYTDDYGLFNYYAYDGLYEVSIFSYSSVPDGTFGGNMISYANCIITDCVTGNQVGVLDGEFTVAINGKDYALTGWMLGRDTVKYTFNFIGLEGSMMYDTNSDFTAEFDLDDAHYDSVGNEKGVIDLNVANDQDQMVTMYIFTELKDGKIPAGIYPINSTKKSNTVFASPGYEDEMGCIPSYAGIMNGVDNMTFVWFFESGYVSVDDNGSVTVSAVNSYEKAINIDIKAAQSALRSVRFGGKNVKAIVNGHVVIKCDGRVYNPAGMTVK